MATKKTKEQQGLLEVELTAEETAWDEVTVEYNAAAADLVAASEELGQVVKEPAITAANISAGPPTSVAANPEQFIAMAMQLKYPPEIIKQFLDMRKELKAEWAKEQFFEALAEYQATYPEIRKGKAVPNKPKGDEVPTIRYYYAPLGVIVSTVRACLKANGFSFIIKPVENNPEAVTARVILHHKDGHTEESSFTAPIDPEAYMNAPQKVASARSFAKRQAFCDVTGTIPSGEDDDAQSLTFDAGVKYADYINAIEAEGDLASLFDTVKAYRAQLREQGDQKGVDLITKVYEKRKKALS